MFLIKSSKASLINNFKFDSYEILSISCNRISQKIINIKYDSLCISSGENMHKINPQIILNRINRWRGLASL